MTDNPRPWRDRITTRTGPNEPLWLDDVIPIAANAAALRGLLDEAHDLAAEVERLRAAGSEVAADAEKAWDEVERLRALLAARPADGPLRVVRDEKGRWATLQLYGDDEVRLTDAEADAIEAQLAAPGNVHPDLVDGTVLIRRWLAGGAVDALALTAEMRQWVDTFDPPPHDLPDGVQPWTAAPIEIDGVPVVGIAMGDVVRGLDDDEWLRTQDRRRWFGIVTNAWASTPAIYLLGRKPTPTPPQTVTVELPQDLVEAMCNEVDIDYHTVAAACRKALGR